MMTDRPTDGAHTRIPECPAALTIEGEHFACDRPTDENGVEHRGGPP
jgi:hypothetical protein